MKVWKVLAGIVGVYACMEVTDICAKGQVLSEIDKVIFLDGNIGDFDEALNSDETCNGAYMTTKMKLIKKARRWFNKNLYGIPEEVHHKTSDELEEAEEA